MGTLASVEDDSALQPDHLDYIDFTFNCPEGRFPYDGGTLPHNTTGFQLEGGTSATVATENMPTNSAYLGGLTPTDTITSASAAASPLSSDWGIYPDSFDFRLRELCDLDLSASIIQSQTNANSISPPPRDGIGDQMIPTHTHEAPATNLVNAGGANARDTAGHVILQLLSSDLPTDLSLPGTFQTGEVSCAPAWWDGIAFIPQTQRDNAPTLAPVGMSESMSYIHVATTLAPLTGDILRDPNADFRRHSPVLNYAGLNFNTATPANVLAATTTTGDAGKAGMVLGKRARKCSSGSRQTRGRSSTVWVLEEAEGSTKRIHHTPATRAQLQDIKCIHGSMTQSREARSITTQGLHPYPSLGPSALQVTIGSPEQGQFERRRHLGRQQESRITQHIEPQMETTEGQERLHAIPRTLTERQQLMLQTTDEDAKCGAVRVIKCKLCPSMQLNSWQCFRRHCNTSEEHPAEITFCDRCGDYFGRRDSEKRHKGKRYQDECRTMPREQAEWKMKTIKQLFEDFNAEMEHCLRAGEELSPRFAAIAQAKVVTTSKRTSKQKKIRSEGDS